MARSAKAEAGERGHRAEQAKVSAALRKVRFSAVPERRRIGLRASWLLPLCAFGVGFAQTSLRAQARLADALQPIHYNQVARVVLRVASLPRLDAERRSFEAEVISAVPEGVPARILVHWSAPNGAGPYGRGNKPPAQFPEIIPGQTWRMAVVMRPPWGPRNPHAFDYERHL